MYPVKRALLHYEKRHNPYLQAYDNRNLTVLSGALVKHLFKGHKLSCNTKADCPNL